MKLSIQKTNDTMTGELSGRLDNKGLASVRYEMKVLEDNADKHIVLDFSGLQFISLSGIRLIQSLQNATKRNGGYMSIKNVAVTVMQLITATGFATLLNFE